MRDFSKWPLEGHIAFYVCLIGLVCLVGARLIDRPSSHETHRDGDFFHMRPLPSHAITGLGLILIVGLLTYGACHARAHSQNLYYAIVLAVGFGFGAVYFFYINYLVRYSFTADGFHVANALTGPKSFPWTSLLGLEHRNGDPILFFPKESYLLPYGLSGRRQLLLVVETFRARPPS